MLDSRIEKIVLGFDTRRPVDRLHSAFCQLYLRVANPHDLGVRLVGADNLPDFNPDDEWEILFTYGAGYEGGGIYNWFAGFLVCCPDHGYVFITTDSLGEVGSGNLGMFEAELGLGISSELELLQVGEVYITLNQEEVLQIESVVKAWHELFEMNEDDGGDEQIRIITKNGRLSKDFKKISGGCYSSGPASDWEDGIGIFSAHWSLLASFGSDG
jgi:hypothetical protein